MVERLKLVRLRTWQRLGNEYLPTVYRKPFAWGGADGIDCCLFAAGMVQAITGTDPMEEFRGQYSDKSGALEALKTIGAGDLKSTLAAKLGASVPAAKAHRFDIGYSRRDDGEECCGIIIGRTVLMLAEPPEGVDPRRCVGMVNVSKISDAFLIPFGD